MIVEKSKRRFRWPRGIVLAATFVVALLALVLWYPSWRDWAAWDAACAEADRDDPGWRAADFFGPESFTPPEPTLTGRVWSIVEKLPAKWPNWATRIRDEDIPVLAALKPPEHSLEPGIELTPAESEEQLKERALSALDMPAPRPLNRVRPEIERGYWREAVRADWVADARALIGSLPAERLGQWQRPLIAHFDVDLQRSRTVVHVLNQHLVLEAEDQRGDESLQDIRSILAVARVQEERPMLISLLVQVALENVAATSTAQALALAQASPVALESLQVRLQQAANATILLRSLQGEQALIEDFVRSYKEGIVTPDQLDGYADLAAQKLTGWQQFDRWLYRIRGGGWHVSQSTEELHYYQALIHDLRSSCDGLTAGDDRSARVRGTMSEKTASSLRSVSMILAADSRRRAILSCAIATVAAERFRLKIGRWPAQLDELVPTYIQKVPADPFDLKPLRLRRVADGLVIYSIGRDFVDNGGDVEDWTKTDGNRVTDLGLRLYDPAHRRLPPVTP